MDIKEKELLKALSDADAIPKSGYGSSLVVIHAGRIVNIEKKESIKLSEK